MRALFGFGENLPGFAVPVLNEREARAGAGILFAISLIAFMKRSSSATSRPSELSR